MIYGGATYGAAALGGAVAEASGAPPATTPVNNSFIAEMERIAALVGGLPFTGEALAPAVTVRSGQQGFTLGIFALRSLSTEALRRLQAAQPGTTAHLCGLLAAALSEQSFVAPMRVQPVTVQEWVTAASAGFAGVMERLGDVRQAARMQVSDFLLAAALLDYLNLSVSVAQTLPLNVALAKSLLLSLGMAQTLDLKGKV